MRLFFLASLAFYLSSLPAAAGNTPKRFLAIGDSITAGFGDPGVDCFTTTGGYPIRLGQLLRGRGLDAVVENHGVCGETTFGGLGRIDSVLQNGGDVLLIMEGTNDLSMPISLESIRFNLAEMARRAIAAGVTPVYAAPIPRTPDCGSNARTELLGGLLAQDAAGAGYEFVDAYGALIDIPNLYDVFYSDPWHPNAPGYDLLARVFVEPSLAAAARPVCATAPGPCVASPTVLCLNQGRFRVEVEWRDFAGNDGHGQGVPRTDDTGFFWFFSPNNLELCIKLLDGRSLNQHFWVFYGALSNVQYKISVTDTATGVCRAYFNPPETQASRGDTEAFPAPVPAAVTGTAATGRSETTKKMTDRPWKETEDAYEANRVEPRGPRGFLDPQPGIE